MNPDSSSPKTIWSVLIGLGRAIVDSTPASLYLPRRKYKRSDLKVNARTPVVDSGTQPRPSRQIRRHMNSKQHSIPILAVTSSPRCAPIARGRKSFSFSPFRSVPKSFPAMSKKAYTKFKFSFSFFACIFSLIKFF